MEQANERTFGSLFTGIVGIDLGLQRSGWTCRWQVEINPFCRAVLARHWPAVKRRRDVRLAGKKNLAPVDLICGGFPCQDISVAGKGDGIEGKQSSLWQEFARIVSELQPSYVLVENVPRLRSGHRGAWMAKVVGDLAALGYDCVWDSVSASFLGAPHRRERLFIVAYADSRVLRKQSRRWCWPGRQGSSFTTDDGHEGALADSERPRQLQPSRRQQAQRGRLGDGSRWKIEPRMGRVAYGIPNWVDRVSGLGNACIPEAIEFIAERYL